MTTVTGKKSLGVYALSFAVLSTLSLTAHASGSTSQQRSQPPHEVKKMATKAGTLAVRVGVGAAVGGTAGKIISGSPAGTAAGILLTPSRIGCGAGETCRTGGK